MDSKIENLVLEMIPSDALDWLINYKEVGKSEDIDWLSLAQGITSNCYQSTLNNKNREDAIIWCEIADKIYLKLSDYNKDQRTGLENSRINIRVFLINHFGPDPLIPYLDPTSVEEWFFANAKWPDNKIDKDNWIYLENEKILELRTLKNQINVIGPLVDKGYLPKEEFGKWLELKNRLP